MPLAELQAIFFDFDGVLAESVHIKTEAFADLYRPYGDDVVQQVVSHHEAHGGMSRYEKFAHYHQQFLGQKTDDAQVHRLAAQFSELVMKKVIAAQPVKGALEFLERWHNRCKMFVVSGTPETEMRIIVNERGMQSFFEAVTGSPAGKADNTRRLLSEYRINPQYSCFIGDARSDQRAAQDTGMPFIARLTAENQAFFTRPGTHVITDLTELEAKLKEVFS